MQARPLACLAPLVRFFFGATGIGGLTGKPARQRAMGLALACGLCQITLHDGLAHVVMREDKAPAGF